PCDVNHEVGNIIDGAAAATQDGANWYMALNYPLYGFGEGGPERVSGTDAIQVLRMGDDVRSLTEETVAGAPQATYVPGVPAFNSGDVVMICDMKALGVFRANGNSSGSGSSGTVSFASGSGVN